MAGRRAELEGKFTSLEGGLDAPERHALWPQLAAVNAALGESEEAGICWLNVLWNEESASEAAAWQWFRAEAAAVPVRPEGVTQPLMGVAPLDRLRQGP